MGTLLIPSGPNADDMHLFVILNKACAAGQHVMLSISRIKDGQQYDDTCVFNGGEHDFITQPSYVRYRKPEQRTSANIANCVHGGLYVPRLPLDKMHFARVCKGILESPHIRPWLEIYCRDNGVI
jgi:hypothetical protein